MTRKAYQSGTGRTNSAAYQRDRRLGKKVLPNECAHCGRHGDETRLQFDHKVGYADYVRMFGEPPPEGVTASEIPALYQWLCKACHNRRSAAQRRRGQDFAKGAARRGGRRRVHPAEALGADLDQEPIVTWRHGGEGPRSG